MFVILILCSFSIYSSSSKASDLTLNNPTVVYGNHDHSGKIIYGKNGNKFVLDETVLINETPVLYGVTTIYQVSGGDVIVLGGSQGGGGPTTCDGFYYVISIFSQIPNVQKITGGCDDHLSFYYDQVANDSLTITLLPSHATWVLEHNGKLVKKVQGVKKNGS